MPQIFDAPLYSGDQSLERVLNAGLPVMLLFLDGPLAAGLDQAARALAKQAAGKLLVVLVDRKDNPQSAARFQIRSAPALVALKDGQPLSQAAGIAGEDLQRHAAYLLGQGPRPEPARSAPAEARPAATAGGAGLDHPLVVSDATFDQEVMRSPLPVVVDFWAPWCGPCRMVAPVLDKLAREWGGRVKIAKVYVDENPRVAGQYQVQSIPTMMVVVNGKIVDRWAGALPEPHMRSRLTARIPTVA